MEELLGNRCASGRAPASTRAVSRPAATGEHDAVHGFGARIGVGRAAVERNAVAAMATACGECGWVTRFSSLVGQLVRSRRELAGVACHQS